MNSFSIKNALFISYNDSRNEYFVKLADFYPMKTFTRLSDAEKIVYILSNTDGNVSRLCASFPYKATKKQTQVVRAVARRKI